MIEIDWKTMPNLSELTIVVPTYNRQKYALRQMHFWSDSPVTLHILDGTSVPINVEALKRLGNNVNYYHMPCSIEERYGKAVEIVDTPYVSFLCDDEFFIPSALAHCVEKLKKHEEFVACAGSSMRFSSSKKGISGKSYCTDLKNYKLDGATAKERMIANMKSCKNPTQYAVQLSSIWKKSLAIVSKHKFSASCPYVQEFQFELTTCYQGKLKVIEELIWLRNSENECIDCEKWNRKLHFNEWLKSPIYADEVKIFYEDTATELAKINGAEKEKVILDLKLAIDAFLCYNNDKYINYPIRTLRDRLLSIIPKKSKQVLEKINTNCRWKQIIKEAEEMQEEGINVDMKQLHEIVEYLEKI